MISEHFGEHLVNTLVNTFPQLMNTMNTPRFTQILFLKKKKSVRLCIILKVFIMFTYI